MKKIVLIVSIVLFFGIYLYSQMEVENFTQEKEYMIYMPEHDKDGKKIDEIIFSKVKYDLIAKFGNIQVIKSEKDKTSILRYNYENKNYKMTKYRIFTCYGFDDMYIRKYKKKLINIFNNFNVIIVKRNVSIL